jgi:hypothetical protein
MALSAFDNKSRQPDADELRATLGRSSRCWTGLLAHAESRYPPLEKTWQFAGAKWGWSLRLKRKKRTILYMTPRRRHFLVGLVLGEKAVRAAHQTQLSASTLEAVDQAPRFAEGRGVRLEIRYKRDLEAAQKLAAVKMAN